MLKDYMTESLILDMQRLINSTTGRGLEYSVDTLASFDFDNLGHRDVDIRKAAVVCLFSLMARINDLYLLRPMSKKLSEVGVTRFPYRINAPLTIKGELMYLNLNATERDVCSFDKQFNTKVGVKALEGKVMAFCQYETSKQVLGVERCKGGVNLNIAVCIGEIKDPRQCLYFLDCGKSISQVCNIAFCRVGAKEEELPSSSDSNLGGSNGSVIEDLIIQEKEIPRQTDSTYTTTHKQTTHIQRPKQSGSLPKTPSRIVEYRNKTQIDGDARQNSFSRPSRTGVAPPNPRKQFKIRTNENNSIAPTEHSILKSRFRHHSNDNSSMAYSQKSTSLIHRSRIFSVKANRKPAFLNPDRQKPVLQAGRQVYQLALPQSSPLMTTIDNKSIKPIDSGMKHNFFLVKNKK